MTIPNVSRTPRIWTDQELADQARVALEEFVDRRLAEPGAPLRSVAGRWWSRRRCACVREGHSGCLGMLIIRPIDKIEESDGMVLVTLVASSLIQIASGIRPTSPMDPPGSLPATGASVSTPWSEHRPQANLR
jgi:hypothetical protein